MTDIDTKHEKEGDIKVEEKPKTTPPITTHENSSPKPNTDSTSTHK